VPPWPATWQMNASTIIMPCNYTGFQVPSTTAGWGIVDFGLAPRVPRPVGSPKQGRLLRNRGCLFEFDTAVLSWGHSTMAIIM
jgi:hypothetical protein